ncbi:MAG: helix-turn-helix transcriptional regulator [Pseudomonadota bacterium]
MIFPQGNYAYSNQKFNFRISKNRIFENGIHPAEMNTYNPQLDGHYQILRDMLTEAREAKKLFQKEIAEKLRKNQAFVSKYEAGERKLDWIEVLNLLEVLGMDELQFLKEFRLRVVDYNSRTETALLQEISERQAKARTEIEEVMRKNNVTFDDLKNSLQKSKKPKPGK